MPLSIFYCAAVNDDLTSTEDEEINCENIKACNDDIVNPVDFHVEAFILESNSTEALRANFVICEHEKSTLETICNREVPVKETISPVHNDPWNEKCKSNMLQGECDFKDELKEDKEETYETILNLKFDDKSAVGVDTFEGNDHRASKGLGYQNGKIKCFFFNSFSISVVLMVSALFFSYLVLSTSSFCATHK